MIDAPASLEAFWDDIRRRLSRAARDRRAPWRTPTLASVDADGAPRARLVVLRAVGDHAERFEIHTDRRSAKWSELGRRQSASLLFWDPGASLQLRVEGAAALSAEDAETAAAFDRLGPAGQAIYGARPAPGTTLDRPEEADQAAPPSPNFGRILVAAARLEALWLGREGHRRAAWTREAEAGWDAETAWRGVWLAP